MTNGLELFLQAKLMELLELEQTEQITCIRLCRGKGQDPPRERLPTSFWVRAIVTDYPVVFVLAVTSPMHCRTTVAGATGVHSQITVRLLTPSVGLFTVSAHMPNMALFCYQLCQATSSEMASVLPGGWGRRATWVRCRESGGVKTCTTRVKCEDSKEPLDRRSKYHGARCNITVLVCLVTTAGF